MSVEILKIPPAPGYTGPNRVVNVSDVQAFILTDRVNGSCLPAKLIPKGIYGISIWVTLLLAKYCFLRPTHRLVGSGGSSTRPT